MNLPERFATGDLEAFEQLFRQFHPEVYRWICRLTRDPGAADDLTVDVFWKIYRARATFDPRRSFGAWARRIASNVAIDHLRRAGRERARDESAGRISLPSRSSGQRDVRLRIERVFLQLPAKLRVVADLAFIDGLDPGEIAEALGISTTAVKFRAIRARRFLRDAFRKEGIGR